MIFLITASYIYMYIYILSCDFLCSSNNLFTMSSMNQKLHWKLTNYNVGHWSNSIYHNIGKSQYKSFSTSPHTQLPYSLSQLLTLAQYLWLWSFNRTQRKIGAYSVPSQPFTSRVMSTIIVHANLHPIGYIYHDLSNTRSFPKDKMKKGKVRITLTQA